VLQVKAPKFVLRPQIDAFISKNRFWIDKEHAKLSERAENKKNYLFGKEIEVGDIQDLEKYYK
jgi:predicted metal-dependent hydrolase